MQQIHTQAYECWIFVSLICCAARAKEVEWNGGLSASALRTESSLAIKGLTKRGRRYRGWSRLRRSPRKWWCGKVMKWQGQSTKKWRLCCRWSRFRQVEDHTAKNRKQTNARWVLLNRKRRKSLRQDPPPLDLSFWSFLTFLHHGIEKVERHLLWKFHKKVQSKSWSNVPPKLLTYIGFLYKVVHKNGRLRKFNGAQEI